MVRARDFGSRLHDPRGRLGKKADAARRVLAGASSRPSSVREGPPPPWRRPVQLGILLALFAALALLVRAYGPVMFLGAPFVLGMAAGYGAASYGQVTALQAARLGALVQVVSAAVLLFAGREGAVCLLMAVPVLLPMGAIGGVLGAALAGLGAGTRGAGGAPLMLPILGLLPAVPPADRMVESSVVVHAPPERVWPVVVAFPDITEPAPWYFRTGVAMSLRARITGEGPGATRRCEFTTGTFVEPITAWEPPRRLAFDVTEQPPPMREWSPDGEVAPPHLTDGSLRSLRGEFELQPLPGERTRLVGRTWSRVAMTPEPYWALWVDAVVHRIHLRVLEHIARVAAETCATAEPVAAPAASTR